MNIDKHPVLAAIHSLSVKIETLPASELQTEISLGLCEIGRDVEWLLDGITGELLRRAIVNMGTKTYDSGEDFDWDAAAKELRGEK